jgi:phospholipase/carboxylesterase
METVLQLITLEPQGPPNASVIWLHGLGADGHDFEPIVAELGLTEGHGIRFVFPHAPVRPITINGGMEMRAWYDISDQGLERGVDESGIRGSAEMVAALIESEVAAGIDSTRIVLAGFSQGGAIALHLGLRYHQRLAGILALSTYLPLAPSLSHEAADAQDKLPIFVGHGSHDPLVPEDFGRRSADMLEEAGYLVEYHTYPMEHAVCAEEIRDISNWMQKRLPPA